MGSFEPGLGHALFGNAWEAHALPDTQIAMLAGLGEAVGAVLGEDPTENSGARWTVPGLFALNAYCWGGCGRSCGFDAAETEWIETHPHSESCFSTRLSDFESEMETEGGFARYSPQGHAAVLDWVRGQGVEIYGYGARCDCGVHEAREAWLAGKGHDPACGAVRPNFEHAPSGLRVDWYKALGRETSTNLVLDDDAFRAIIDECIARVAEGHDGYEDDKE